VTGEQETARAETAAPVLRIVNADATPEEVAALVAVFSALGSGGAEAPKRPRPAWSSPARDVRRTHPHGPDAWRASGLPR
jgi:Acyl-CoA carboxylase epsilon subunit